MESVSQSWVRKTGSYQYHWYRLHKNGPISESKASEMLSISSSICSENIYSNLSENISSNCKTMSNYKNSLKNLENLPKDIKIAFVVADFNEKYTHEIAHINKNFLEENGFNNIDTFFVPGAFEIPGFTKSLIKTGKYSLMITIGVVIRGDTPHFDYVCGETSRGIMNLNIKFPETPTIFGLLTCNTEEQVQERIGPNFAIAGLNLLSEKSKISLW